MKIAIISDDFLILVVSSSVRKSCKDALIKVLYQENNWSLRRLLREFPGKNCGPAAEEN